MTRKKYDFAGAHDVLEQKIQGKRPPPADASAFDQIVVKTKRSGVPWLYDYDYGWTPQTEAAAPRPQVQFPPKYLDSFPLVTAGPDANARYTVTVDLRSYPAGAIVYLVVPTKLLPPGWRDPSPAFFRGVGLPKTTNEFNAYFGTQYTNAASSKEVVLEFQPACRAFLDRLLLTPERTSLRVCIVLPTDKLAPKTASFIHLEQRINGQLMGTFDHYLHAYHRYDLPIVGDLRTRLAHRRTDPAVMDIPPEAIACFDSWEGARASGFDVAPVGFARHYPLKLVSNELAQVILEYFNDPALTAQKIHDDVADNPWVNAVGQALATPESQRGVSVKIAKRILEAREKLKDRQKKRAKKLAGRKLTGKKLAAKNLTDKKAVREPANGFTNIAQIDGVRGVGEDTMSDIITSLLYKLVATKRARKARQDPRAQNGWMPDPKVLRHLKKRK